MQPSHSPRILLLLFALAVGLAGGSHARALPAGRMWTPYTQMQIAHTIDNEFLGMPLLLSDSTGAPYFMIEVTWDTASVGRRATFGWQDSAWVLADPGIHASASHAEASVGSGSTRSLAWLTPAGGPDLRPWLAVANYSVRGAAPGDSAFKTSSQSTEWAIATSRYRRWVVRSEQRLPDYEFHVRVFHSDTLRLWREVERLGVDEDHCTIAPLGDTTAMVVYAGLSGLEYAILDGSRWIERGNLDPRPFNAAHPRLRLRRSGGLWLFWAAHDWMHMSTYRNGAWERGDSLQCVPNLGETFTPSFLVAEHDTTEYPAIGWTNAGYGQTLRDVTAIALSNGHGWDAGEEISNSEQSGWFEPTLTHDLNNDLWLMWRRAREGINRWVHTFCAATTPAPAVSAQGGGSRVQWVLSSGAPRSRWTVERALGDAEFDSIGTVRAAYDSVLVFDDATATPGATWRYRIRRECLDIRYRWTSNTTQYWRPDTQRAIGLSLANPSSEQLSIRLAGAAGTLTARLYDLQGRLVVQQRFDASGTGTDAFTVNLGGSGAHRSGIYFLRVSDATGRTSRTARVAVVR